MPIIDRLKEAGVLVLISGGSLLVSLLFVWIAFTCTGWGGYARQEKDHYVKDGLAFGLWRVCDDRKYMTPCKPLDGVPVEWFGMVQAGVIFGFFGINIAFLLLILYVFVPSCQRNKEVGMATSVICVGTAGLYLIGVIIFAVRYKRDYINELEEDFKFGYCFFLSILAILLEAGAGVALFFEARLNGRVSAEGQNLTASTGYQTNPTYGASSTTESIS